METAVKNIKVKKKNRSSMSKIFNYQMILFLVLVFLIIMFGVMEEGIMFRPKVLFGLTANVVEIGLMSLPMTFIILTGGIDLSVGSTMALSGVVLGAAYSSTGNIALAMILSMTTGTLCGMFNGLVISRTKISPLVTTLATYSLYYGIARIMSGTNIYSNFPEGFKFLAYNKFMNVIPYQFILLVIGAAIFIIVNKKTILGVYLKGIGLNEEAIKFAGISVTKIKFAIYTLSGMICTTSAFIYLSRLPAAKPDMGLNLNLETITAVVLGGTSINGGKGTVIGTVISILILGVLRKGLQLIGFGGDVYTFILGIVLVICLIGFSISEKAGKKVKK